MKKPISNLIKMVNKSKWSIVIAIVLLIFAVASRFLPHLPNFTPVAAVALFGGFYLDKRLDVILPLIIMVTSDLMIGLHNLIFFTWGCMIVTSLIGIWLRKRRNISTIILGTLMSSIIFFVVTNAAVFFMTPLYSKSLAGLIQCYYMAIPFFRNSLAGDLFYVGILFGSFEIIQYIITQKEKNKVYI